METILNAYMHTYIYMHKHTHARTCAHTHTRTNTHSTHTLHTDTRTHQYTILTIQKSIYAQLKQTTNRDFRQRKTTARNKKYGMSIVLHSSTKRMQINSALPS